MNKLLAACTASLVLLAAFTPHKKSKIKLPDEFVFIAGGTMHSGPDTCSLHNQADPHRVSVLSFYISKYEVTNGQYKQFYNEIVSKLSEEEKKLAACDTLGWRTEVAYNEALVRYYYQHPGYNNYPVVSISHEGAKLYCQWLQKKIEAENPGFTIEVSLPSKDQWVYAAQGGRSMAMYPWGNYYLRNRKGEFLCNFKRVGDQSIVRNRQTGKPEVRELFLSGLSETAFYTAVVKSFYPNDYGLYNTCGNVAEMISQRGIAMGGSWNDYGGDVHIRSESRYDKPEPTIGFRPLITVKRKGE
jgi:formylglycine-generating enzyme required for sulfatase activity